MFMQQGPLAILLSPRTPKAFLLYAKGILAMATASSSLAYAGLAELEADIAELDDAQTLAHDRTPTAVADRDARALKVYQGLGHFRDYVQGVAEKQASLADAVAVIVGAGLSVKKTRGYAKPVLAAKHGGISGEVLLVALAIAGAGAYYWEVSVDQLVWSTAPETTQADTAISGLTPGQMYYFRFRALTPKGKRDYSQVVSLRVR